MGMSKRGVDGTCVFCRWFKTEDSLPEVGGAGNSASGISMLMDRLEGECRRLSPSIEGFPKIKGGDWCGKLAYGDTET